MRIRSVGLQSVLHFSDYSLDFGGEGPHLHILAGPNEAGKSTLLNAMLDWLFGGSIAAESRDYYDPKSRLGGVIEGDPAHTVSIWRKKRYSQMVLADGGEPPITEDDLGALLGGYDRERFMLLFGFNHERLRAGGVSLMQSGGHAGVSLFEAGGGVQHLQMVLEQLQKRAGDLLDPGFRSTSAKILNRAWREFQAAERAVRETSLRTEEWNRQRDAIADLSQEVEGAEREVASAQAARAKLQRVARVRSQIGRIRALRQQMADLGPPVLLPPELDTRIPLMVQERRELIQSLERWALEVERQDQKLEAAASDPAVLDQAEAIAGMTEGLKQYLTRMNEEIPSIQEQFNALERETESLLEEISLGTERDRHALSRIPFVDVQRVEIFFEAWNAMRQERELAVREVDARAAELAQTDRALMALGPILDAAALESVMLRVREGGDIDQYIVQDTAAIDERREALVQLLRRQSVWQGSLKDLSALPVPMPETLDAFERSWREREQCQDQWDREIERLGQERERVAHELGELERLGPVPDEKDVASARSHRDWGWRLVKDAWLSAGPEDPAAEEAFANGRPLPEAYESAVKAADATVDRLRRESERSARHAMLTRDRDAVESKMAETLSKRDAETERFLALQDDWREQWLPAGIEPRPPEEMKAWMARYFFPLCQGLDQLASLKRERDRRVALRDAVHERLSHVLMELGERVPQGLDLKALAARGEAWLKRAAAHKDRREFLSQQREQTTRKLSESEESLRRLSRRLQEWEGDWSAFRSRYPEMPPEPNVAVLYARKLEEWFNRQKSMERLQAELAHKQEACQMFEAKAGELVAALGEPVETFAALTDWVHHLRDRLERAQAAQAARKGILEDKGRVAAEIEAAKARLTGMDAELSGLQATYRCSDNAALASVADRSTAYKRLQEDLAKAEQVVMESGDGLPVAALESELAELDNPDDLSGRLERLSSEIRERTEHLEEKKRQLYDLKRAFADLDGRDDTAAQKAWEAQSHLAEVDRHWNEYLRVELARRLLGRAVDRFRENNQGTVVQRAGELFRRLTREHYPELIVDSDGGAPILTAVTADGQRRGVAQMSDGTRDQLFLALRLAFVEKHLAGGAEPLPLMMDDILVHFDDARTAATLGVLTELAQKTQILYFTHHQAVVDAARRADSSGRVRVHVLDPS